MDRETKIEALKYLVRASKRPILILHESVQKSDEFRLKDLKEIFPDIFPIKLELVMQKIDFTKIEKKELYYAYGLEYMALVNVRGLCEFIETNKVILSFAGETIFNFDPAIINRCSLINLAED